MHQLILTADGSHTLHNELLGEHYHSIHGAIQESRHVFIEAGLKALDAGIDPIDILEVGFGTGLNALLTIAAPGDKTIHYDALEAFPLSEEIFSKLNYGTLVPDSEKFFKKIHACPWDAPTQITPGFTLTKLSTSLQCFVPYKNYDLIYFDAFAPAVQPEMWTIGIFEKLFSVMKPGGVVVTYCAQGQVKRDLKTVGFTVEGIAGPPGKREMTRGRKNLDFRI